MEENRRMAWFKSSFYRFSWG